MLRLRGRDGVIGKTRMSGNGKEFKEDLVARGEVHMFEGRCLRQISLFSLECAGEFSRVSVTEFTTVSWEIFGAVTERV